MTRLPITLAEGFLLDVAVGESVHEGQLLAHKQIALEQVINIPEGLQLSLAKAKKVILKNPGERIVKGDLLAAKKNFFGKQVAAIVSEIDGIVLRYERDSGNLVIRSEENAASNEVFSPVAGEVELCNNKEIVLRTDNALIGGRAVSGTRSTGEIFILEESFTGAGGNNLLFFLDNRAIGKIVLGGSINRDVLMKGVGIGIAGLVGVSIQDQDLQYLQEKNISLPVMEIDMDSMSKLKKLQGKKVTIDAQNKTIIFITNTNI